MVEFIEDTANQHCVCKSDKFVNDLIIEKAKDGYIFFKIRFAKGVTPAELSGNYTSLKSAKKAVEKFVRNAKESKAARTAYFNEKREERKKQNGSKDQPKDGEHLREGSDH